MFLNFYLFNNNIEKLNHTKTFVFHIHIYENIKRKRGYANCDMEPKIVQQMNKVISHLKKRRKKQPMGLVLSLWEKFQ